MLQEVDGLEYTRTHRYLHETRRVIGNDGLIRDSERGHFPPGVLLIKSQEMEDAASKTS